MNPTMHKNYTVVDYLAPYRIAAITGTGGAMAVKQAAAATDALIGTADELGTASNGTADIALAGLPEVECGGAILAGAAITADAQGRAVTAAAAERIIGFALADGAEGVIIPYIHAPGFCAA